VKTAAKRIHFLRGCAGLLDFLEQCRGEFARQFLIGVGNQRIDAAEMMIEQTDGNPGLGGDAPHGNPGMAVAAQAAQGGGDQQFATLVRLGAAVFGAVVVTGDSLAVVPRWRA
jgi:hypothetical protein